MALGWPLYELARLAYRSQLCTADVQRVEELGKQCLEALRAAVPSDYHQKCKWHYVFCHLHQMLSRYARNLRCVREGECTRGVHSHKYS
jgi:hypothetical protein